MHRLFIVLIVCACLIPTAVRIAVSRNLDDGPRIPGSANIGAIPFAGPGSLSPAEDAEGRDGANSAHRPMWIKMILILGGLALSIFYFTYLKSMLLDRLLMLTGFVALSIFVLVPDLTTKLANLLGVDRGTDLILYMWVIFSSFLFMLIALRAKHNSRLLTLVVRQLALHHAHEPQTENPPARNSNKQTPDTAN